MTFFSFFSLKIRQVQTYFVSLSVQSLISGSFFGLEPQLKRARRSASQSPLLRPRKFNDQ